MKKLDVGDLCLLSGARAHAPMWLYQQGEAIYPTERDVNNASNTFQGKVAEARAKKSLGDVLG